MWQNKLSTVVKSRYTIQRGYDVNDISSDSSGKESACQCRRCKTCKFNPWVGYSLISRLRRFPGRENGNPQQYSCLGNPMDRGAWWVKVSWHGIVHKVAKNWTRLNDSACIHDVNDVLEMVQHRSSAINRNTYVEISIRNVVFWISFFFHLKCLNSI